MIKHLVLFRWNDDASATDREGTLEALRRLRDTVPGVVSLVVGEDVAGRGTYHFAMSSDFEDGDSLAGYITHPDHRSVMTDYISHYVQPAPEVLDFVYSP